MSSFFKLQYKKIFFFHFYNNNNDNNDFIVKKNFTISDNVLGAN